ncbi:M24 family metallopeptidase [Prauserella rugosa]|uniref:Xaa-Pro aminopeptidase n=1 Tax=Prauserella rugosa TaxID=43354 RepID=A0A660CAY7_9PSEU|nr:Xaa-Pro peptidase family protein [Prauserella rugosa]KMS90989.1 X-Pro dipeptidase [Streptomyces regensis]TWH18923.1 Xaa-Pro aminopeptidase [Prauserella rugosa]
MSVSSPGSQAEAHPRRRAALRELVGAADLDALLVTDLRNIRYLTGFTGSNAALLLHAGGEQDTVFCTDGRYTTQAASEVPDLTTVVDRASARALAATVGGDRCRYGRVGFESQYVSVEQAADLDEVTGESELRRSPGLVERLREVKDEVEIDALRRACAAADRAWASLLAVGGVRPGRTERDVARDLEARMLDEGSEAAAFPSIVAAGAHSAIPHHRPTDAVLRMGDLVKADFGATVDGYHSDMTRTVVLGEPAEWQKEIHDLVRAAQEAGVAAAVPGADTAEVDATSRRVIADAGRGAEFLHGLGHGVGLEVHEAPSLATTAAGTLAAGMAVTVEPGVYLAGRGGVRIEDTLVVRESAPEVLTLSTKELVVV